MKKLLLVLFVASIGLTACQKEYTCCLTSDSTQCDPPVKYTKTAKETKEALGYTCTK